MMNDNLAAPAIISGLVVTLSTDAALSRDAVRTLRSHNQLTVGEEWGRWVPVSIEADDDEACREIHDWITTLDGVVYVDVVAVTFDTGFEETSFTPSLQH